MPRKNDFIAINNPNLDKRVDSTQEQKKQSEIEKRAKQLAKYWRSIESNDNEDSTYLNGRTTQNKE